MKVLIIEDEVMAAERLEGLILHAFPGTEICARLESVSKAVAWFRENKAPDLAFFDIQLADGLSFEIFEKTRVHCPVIFTTAYDEYALKAFKVNSIDYLLKPIDEEELSTAIDKFRMLQAGQDAPAPAAPDMGQVLKLLTRQYKSRFLVKVGEHIKSIPVEEIICFYSMAKAAYIQTIENRHYVMDHSLEQIEELVDPAMFFRVNRKFIIAINAIADIISFTNSRLKIRLSHPSEEEIIVAREKVKEFKAWLER